MEFALKVIASFLVGGAYVALVTYVSEHINPRIGGILTGLPSTALIGLIFIALTQNDNAAVQASVVVPAGFGFTVLLVAFYAHLRRHDPINWAAAKSIGLWLALAALTFSLLPKSMLLATLLFIVCFIVAITSLEKYNVKASERVAISSQELLIRALLVGSLIAVAVICAKVIGAFIGGIITSFPIIVISSLTILDRRRGINLMTATAKTIPFGSFGTVAFLVGFHFLVPPLGLAIGLLVSYAISVVAAVIALQTRLTLINKH